MASRRGPDNSIRLVVDWSAYGVNMANVFWIQATTSGTPSQADLDAYATAFVTAYYTRFKNRISPNWLLSNVKATMFLPGGSVLESNLPASGAGTYTSGNDAPASASIIVSWLSNVYWRGGKPRTYLPGLRTTDVSTPTTLTSASTAAVDGNAGLFRTDANALTQGAITGSTLGFVSFRSGNTDRPAPLFFSFTGHKVHGRIGTQRRRLGPYQA